MGTSSDARGTDVGPGQLLAGRYRLSRPVGRGAMGTVWLAQDERLRRAVALKQVFAVAGLAEDEAAGRRAAVLREGRAAARVRHAHAIAVHDVAVDAGQAWLVMEHFPAESLGARLAGGSTLAPRDAARVGADVADALAAAHEAGVVHADVKPGNVLVGTSGAVKLTDFGIARMMSEAAGSAEDDIVGTPVYFSPEVARGLDPTAASDVFSLGATVWTLVTGGPPFGADDDTRALLRRVAAAELPDLAPAGPLAPVLAELMAPDPARRPDARAAHAMLAAVATGREPRPAPSTPAAPAAPSAADPVRHAPRPPVLAVVLVVGVLLALAVLVGVVISSL